MAEYIEREAAIKAIVPLPWRSHVAACRAVEALEAIPAADVQEVTRCRDCIHFATDKPTDVFGRCLLHMLKPTIDDMYCAWATRKDGKGDAV